MKEMRGELDVSECVVSATRKTIERHGKVHYIFSVHARNLRGSEMETILPAAPSVECAQEWIRALAPGHGRSSGGTFEEDISLHRAQEEQEDFDLVVGMDSDGIDGVSDEEVGKPFATRKNPLLVIHSTIH